jgi:hypothetical protein
MTTQNPGLETLVFSARFMQNLMKELCRKDLMKNLM